MPNKQNGVSFSVALNQRMSKIRNCAFFEAIKNLPPDELTAVTDAMAVEPSSLPTNLIRSALADSGVIVSRHAIYTHRSGNCICVNR